MPFFATSSRTDMRQPRNQLTRAALYSPAATQHQARCAQREQRGCGGLGDGGDDGAGEADDENPSASPEGGLLKRGNGISKHVEFFAHHADKGIGAEIVD